MWLLSNKRSLRKLGRHQRKPPSQQRCSNTGPYFCLGVCAHHACPMKTAPHVVTTRYLVTYLLRYLICMLGPTTTDLHSIHSRSTKVLWRYGDTESGARPLVAWRFGR